MTRRDDPMEMWASTDGLDIAHALYPPVSKIDFYNKSACCTHTSILRTAWKCGPLGKPWENAGQKPEGPLRLKAQREAVYSTFRWLQGNEAGTILPQESKENTHTEWRKACYYRVSHLYVDVSAFLEDTSPKFGHWHHPDTETEEPMPYGELVIKHEESGRNAHLMHWHKNVLLLPIFLDDDVAINVYRRPVQREIHLDEWVPVGYWDSSKDNEIWHIRSEVELRFDVVDLSNEPRTGVAAVFTFARLCINYRQMSFQEAAKSLIKFAKGEPVVEEEEEVSATSKTSSFQDEIRPED